VIELRSLWAVGVVDAFQIIVAGFGAPLSYILYFMAAWWIWGSRPALAFLVCLPFFSYARYQTEHPSVCTIMKHANAADVSIRVLEKGMEQLKLLQAIFHLARARQEFNSLKQIRSELQDEVHRLVEELSPKCTSFLNSKDSHLVQIILFTNSSFLC